VIIEQACRPQAAVARAGTRSQLRPWIPECDTRPLASCSEFDPKRPALYYAWVLEIPTSAPPAGWPRIVVRVVGGWIAAAGLLMLGWLVHSAA
jgi:hypothetical protein